MELQAHVFQNLFWVEVWGGGWREEKSRSKYVYYTIQHHKSVLSIQVKDEKSKRVTKYM